MTNAPKPPVAVEPQDTDAAIKMLEFAFRNASSRTLRDVDLHDIAICFAEQRLRLAENEHGDIVTIAYMMGAKDERGRGPFKSGAATGAESAQVPDGCVLTESRLDDDCGCPEEMWDTPWGELHMHLSAGKASNARLDNSDEGERHIELTTATVDEARAAIFGWARHIVTQPTPRQVALAAMTAADDELGLPDEPVVPA